MPARRRPDSFVCKGCGERITRAPSPARDYRRTFCSSTCKIRDWYRTHEKEWYQPSVACLLRKEIRNALEITLDRAFRRPRPCSFCRLPLGIESRHAGRIMHRRCGLECSRQRSLEIGRAKRSDPEYQRKQHPPTWKVCPCCGDGFTTEYGDKRRAYCSARCSKAMRKYHLTGLSKISGDEGNRLAALIALVKRARRIINHGSPEFPSGPRDAGPRSSECSESKTRGGPFL